MKTLAAWRGGWLSRGVNLTEALVARGLALAYRRYSKSCVDEERAARPAVSKSPGGDVSARINKQPRYKAAHSANGIQTMMARAKG